MLVKSLTYKGFSGELDGVEKDKNKEKMGFWVRNGEVLRLIKKIKKLK